MFNRIDKALVRQVLRFLVAGGSAVGTDALVYFLLVGVGFEKSFAKGLSFLSGTVVAYVINKFWTFERPERSLAEVFKFALLYGFTLGVNVGVNALVLALLPGQITLAFLCATGTSTVLNFLGQKFFVFRRF